MSVRVCLYVLCGHLLGKGWPLGSRLWCFLWVCHFPIGILGQVWYLIVSIPDLCTFTYFLYCMYNYWNHGRHMISFQKVVSICSWGSESRLISNKKPGKPMNVIWKYFDSKMCTCMCRECSGSVVECLTGDWRAAGSSLTSVTVLCPWVRYIYPCIVLVQPRKTHPDIIEKLLTGT